MELERTKDLSMVETEVVVEFGLVPRLVVEIPVLPL